MNYPNYIHKTLPEYIGQKRDPSSSQNTHITHPIATIAPTHPFPTALPTAEFGDPDPDPVAAATVPVLTTVSPMLFVVVTTVVCAAAVSLPPLPATALAAVTVHSTPRIDQVIVGPPGGAVSVPLTVDSASLPNDFDKESGSRNFPPAGGSIPHFETQLEPLMASAQVPRLSWLS